MNNNIEENNNMNIFSATPGSVNTANNSVNTISQTSNPTVNNIPVVNESTPNATQSVSMNNNATNNAVEVKEPVVEEKTTTTAPVISSTTSTDENIIEIGEKYLPIGTVVMLKGGKKRAMITGFCSVPKEDPKKMYDYSGCIYPEGFISSEMVCLFNHDQIDKVYYKGLIDDEETKFKTDLKRLLDQMNKDGITIDDLTKMATEAVEKESQRKNEEEISSNSKVVNNNDNASSAIPEMPN